MREHEQRMQQGNITVNGCRIHYRQAGDPQAPAIFLLHGNSMSGRCFTPQLTSSLTQRYRLIAIDLPGHGESARLTLSDYNLPAYAKLVSAALMALDAPGAVLVGWSLGGHALLQATQYLPETAGLMLVGTPPLGQMQDALSAFLPAPDTIMYQEKVSRTQAQAFAQACLHPDAVIDSSSMVDDILACDGTARLGLLQPEVAFTDEVSIARNLQVPLAMVVGEGEQLVSLAYIEALRLEGLWRGQIQVLPGVGHTPHLEAPQAFNALLEAFAQDCHAAAQGGSLPAV